MKFFIIVLNYLFFTPQIFAADHDLYPLDEERVHTIGFSNPSSVRLSFNVITDLTDYFESQGFDAITLSLSGFEIDIPASLFHKTERISISEKFPIFNQRDKKCSSVRKINNLKFSGSFFYKYKTPSGEVLYDNDKKCSSVRKINNLKFSGSLYRKYQTPSDEVLYDVGNPLEAICFEFGCDAGNLTLRILTKYKNRDKFKPPSWGKKNEDYGMERARYFQKLLELGYELEAKKGLLEIARNHDVCRDQRLKIADILSKEFPQDFLVLKEEIMESASDDESCETVDQENEVVVFKPHDRAKSCCVIG